jgi:hypothetical protein
MHSLLFGYPDPDAPTDTPPPPPILTHTTRPANLPAENILCIHSEGDRVIHPLLVEQLAERWECPFIKLLSNAQPDPPHVEWGNDVRHDFIAKDLLLKVIELVASHAAKV